MANVAGLSASPKKNKNEQRQFKGTQRDEIDRNISPERIRQILAEKEEFILSLERQLGGVMEELSAARGEQLKWQRKHQQQEGYIAKYQEKIKIFESNPHSNGSRPPQRSDQGRSSLQAGALSSLNRYQYQKDSSDNYYGQISNEKRDQPQQSPRKQQNYLNARNYIDDYNQPELQMQVNSEKKHIKIQKPMKFIPSEEDVNFYSEQKPTKGDRKQFHNPAGYYENGQSYSQYQPNQKNQQQQYSQDTNIFSIPRHNQIHRRLQSTPNISLIKIPSCKLQKLSSKEVKHRLHLIPTAVHQ